MVTRNWKIRIDQCHRLLAISMCLTAILHFDLCSGLAQSGVEVAKTRWKIVESDCRLQPRVPIHRICTEQFYSEPDSEMFYFTVVEGNYLRVAYDVEPAYVIRELVPAVMVRAMRSGVQLYARVILPHFPDPDDPFGKPLAVLIEGPKVKDTNQWRKLSFASLETDMAGLLKQKMTFLRSKYGNRVNDREAYVDQILVNLATGPGEYHVWLDDPVVTGVVTVPPEVTQRGRGRQPATPIFDSQVQSASFESGTISYPTPSIKIDGTVIEIDGRPFAARIIEHNGEPFDFLADLGFNILSLKLPPRRDELDQARRLGIWLIAPPPQQAGLAPFDSDYDRVIAWHVGSDLTAKDFERTRMTIREIRHSDSWKTRPIIAHPAADWEAFSMLTDIGVNGFELLGGSFQLSQYSNWLRQRSELASRTQPQWAILQTEFPATYVNQASLLIGRTPPLPIDPIQVQSMMYETIAGGARGHWFPSRTRLDGRDPQSELRALTIRWINMQLQQLEPWIAGGAVIKALDSLQAEAEVTSIKTNRSLLMLVQRPTYMEQWFAGSPEVKSVVISNPTPTSNDQVFQLAGSSLLPLDRSRQLNSAQIRIDNCPTNTAILLTQEPNVIRALNELEQRQSNRTITQLQIELARRWLIVSQIVGEQLQRSGNGIGEATGAINEANNLLQQITQLAAAGSPASSIPYLNRADQRLALARQAIILRGRRAFANTNAIPLFASITTLPGYWDLSQRLERDSWLPNGLVGGELEDLAHLTSNRWENVRTNDNTVTTRVELTSVAARGGANGLLLSAQSSKTLIENDTVWIKSAPVRVRPGQLIRIHGWVNIPEPIQGNLDGFMIYDSYAGRELAERFTVTQGWQEFSLYRGIGEDTDVRINFVLCGTGQVMLDEVTLRTAQLPTPDAPRQAELEPAPLPQLDRK
ncbi:MAG TPA: hypothetical protein PKD64_03370 [Pirellulaceae bacterium]|nr:hypothetical protein [Pirellulaceae bacterium]HMP70793.1 hypothetical protein [Pirellulaceae bacterium]